ncbi:MAG: hypothetical protein GY696_29170 [Gammaproteobacteria bacterium]|nr:hypothetical protein [Gammaproteobacteria bacterium]
MNSKEKKMLLVNYESNGEFETTVSVKACSGHVVFAELANSEVYYKGANCFIQVEVIHPNLYFKGSSVVRLPGRITLGKIAINVSNSKLFHVSYVKEDLIRGILEKSEKEAIFLAMKTLTETQLEWVEEDSEEYRRLVDILLHLDELDVIKKAYE